MQLGAFPNFQSNTSILLHIFIISEYHATTHPYDRLESIQAWNRCDIYYCRG